YLTCEEVNDLIPHGVHSPDDLDDLLTTIGTQGIDVIEGQPKLPSSALEKKLKEVEVGQGVPLDQTAGALETVKDPARIYLRELGMVQTHFKRARHLAGRLPTSPAKRKARQYRRSRCSLGREIVRISLIIRSFRFTNFERRRLIDHVNKTVDIMRSLEQGVSNLEG